ncbi:MAG: MazG nucleotide pyrophosphohydrolase domain-containing protein [Dermatophilaceae bacterium]
MTARVHLLRTGPWRGAPLLRREAWLLLEGAAVLGLRSDPYAVGLAAAGLHVTLADSLTELADRIAGPASARPDQQPDERRDQQPDERRDQQPDERPVVVVDSSLGGDLASELGRHTVMSGEPDLTGLRLLDVVAVMDRLRSPGGCPWDAQQTHASLRPYLLEEANEAAEAIDSGDLAHLAEELGDVLLQVAFHARVGAEHPSEPFDIDDVAAGLVAKLVRRHPHVFGDVVADTPEQVAANWAEIKAAEQAAKAAGRTSEGIAARG